MTSFTINADFVRVVEQLKDAERGRLWTAMCKYALTGEDTVLSGNESYLWQASKLMIDGSLVVTDVSVKNNGKSVKNHTYILERDINTNSSNETTTNKTTKKHTSTDYSVEFEHFWTEYPKDRHVDKQLAYQEWEKIKPGEELVEKIIQGVKAWKACEQWDDPKYIPHPQKFLKLKRWESTPPERRQQNPALRYEQKPIPHEDFDQMVVNLDEIRID